MFVLIISICVASSVAQVPTVISQGIPTSSPLNETLKLDKFDYNEERYIERPCEFFDMYCIRKYFKTHSQCKEAYGPVPDPIYRPQFTAYLSRVNLTIIFNNVIYTGLNGKIDEFYINKYTDNLVLAVEFNDVTFSSKAANFRYHRTGREPIVIQDEVSSTINSNVVTITIPNLKNLRLDRAEVFAFVNAEPQVLAIGPSILNSEDPTVVQANAEFFLSLGINIQEAELTEAPFFIGSYIQYNLCDFGLEIR